MNQGALAPLLPFLKTAFGLSYVASATILLVATMTSSAIQPVFGYLADRATRRWLLPWAVLLAATGISLAGIVTFPRAEELRDVAGLVPLDRLLIETDSPFLAPVPLRGKRNEPANVGRVADVIAEVRGVAREEIETATSHNFVKVFAP